MSNGAWLEQFRRERDAAFAVLRSFVAACETPNINYLQLGIALAQAKCLVETDTHRPTE